MDRIFMGCQVCLTTFNRISDLKAHMYSNAHQQKMVDVFQQDIFNTHGVFPSVALLNQKAKLHQIRQPIIGLSMCFSGETSGAFYLCHVCEEKIHIKQIMPHLCSIAHRSNYFNCTNPNALSFSWIPSGDMRHILRPEVTQEVKEKRHAQLQMLDLPGNLLTQLKSCTYSEAMDIFSEINKLVKQLEDVKPKRMMIQTYQRDRNREHPLLGLQHLIECICVGQTEKRHYLCTICCLTLPTRMIIKHVLSFDHIFCYFRAWHPSTLSARESYREYTMSFASRMLDLAKQTEKIHGTANTDMKQVSLEPAKFKSVNFTCYAKALEKLESIRKENKEESLITNITPGNRLELYNVSYKLRCQNCKESFNNMRQYCRHVSTWEHKQMLKKSRDGEWKPSLGLYKYLIGSLRQNQAVVGVPLIVTLISTQVQNEPIYICFACEDCFSESSVKQHLDSRKHVTHGVLYQNPWRLTFAWQNHLYLKDLRSMAWEEEKERPNQMMLKILDIPNWMLQSLRTLSYIKVMKILELQHTVLMRDVPKCETYSRLQQNERFPLLGKQFLIMYNVCDRRQQNTGVAFLCLLCMRTLSDDECYTHVFSREHVATFLNHFHPGSLNASTDEETVLDLAKQAANIHSISHVQVITLDTPIWEPCSYTTALSILIAASMKQGKARLHPPIVIKKKLFPRGTLKDVDEDHVSDNNQQNSRMMEDCEETKSQKSTDNCETTLNKVPVEVGAEVTSSRCVESGENAVKRDDKETPAPSEKESEQRGGVFLETGSVELKNAGSEARQVIKEEKIEGPTAGNGETPENSLNTDKNDPTETGKEDSESSKDVLTQLTQKRKVSPCHIEDVEQEMSHKRQRLTSKEDAFCEETQNLTSSKKAGQKEATTADKAERGKQNHETTTNKGSSAPLECDSDERDSLHLHECCSLKVPEEEFISHVTGVDHQRTDLVVDLDGETLSKQNCKSATQTKELQNQQDISHELPSTSALSGVRPVDTSVTLHAQHEVCSVMDNHQVEHMEIDSDSDNSISAAVSGITEATSNTTKVPPESNEDVRMTDIRVSQSADNTDTCSDEDKAQIISNTTVGPLKIATTSEISGTSETAADCTVTIPTTSLTAISKFTAKSSSSAPDTTKSTAPSSRLRASTSSCTTATKKLRETGDQCTSTISAISSATSITKSATLSELLKSRTGAAGKVPATSHKAAAASSTGSKVAREAVCSSAPASKVENTLRNSENASKTVVASRTVETSVAAAKMTVKCINTEAHVAPNIHKSNASAALHLTPPKNPPTEPSHNPASKKRSSANPPEVGINQLIKVICEGKKQLYCLLCSVRLPGRWHIFGFTHQYNYMKMKFPEQVSQLKPSELQSELPKLATLLAEADRDAGSKFLSAVKVNFDEYKELAALPEDNAIERLKAIVKQKDLRLSSPSTTDTGVSPCEATSPDDAVKMVKPQRCAPPLTTDAAGSFSQTPDMCQETPEKRQQQERSRPELQGARKVLEGSQKASPVKLLNLDQLSSAATVNTDQQTQRGPRQTEHVSKQSQALPMISIGESIEGRSNLSAIYLKGLREPVIGLGFVWECRGISVHTFYLCESCSKTLPLRDIRQHMVSADHQYNVILRHHPGFLHFWSDECLFPWMKQNILNGIAKRVSKQERFNEMDAQVILLGPEMCEPIRAAPFSDALKMLQDIKKQKKLTIPHSAIFTPQQKGARQKTEEHHLEETVGDLDGVKQRSPLDVTRVPSKADPVVSPFTSAGTCLSPQEQPEPRPPVYQHQRPCAELQVKQAELLSESPSSSVVTPKTSQTLTVFPRDQCFPTRKRAAVESVDTVIRSCTDNLQLVDPPAAKCSELQRVSSVSSTPLFKDTESEFDGQDILTMDRSYVDELIALVKQLRSNKDMSFFISALGNGETTTSCANNSSESGVERIWDPEPVQTMSNVATEQARCDSKWLEVTKNPPSAISVEKVSTAAPEVLSHDNALVASNASSAFTSSLEGSSLTRVDLLVGETEANKTDPSDPQNQMDAESTVGSQSHPSPIYDNPGQISQPDNTETDSTGVHQLPINAIVTARSKRPNQQFMGNYKRQDNSEMNRGNQVTHSISTVTTVNPSGTSGGYGQYSQMVYVTKGQSGYFSSEAVGSYTTPANPSLYTESSYQCEGYTIWPYPSQIYPE